MGFFPLQRMRGQGSGRRGHARPATFRPQGFDPLGGLLPPTPRQAFRPSSTPGVRPSGLYSRRAAGPLSRPPPLLPFTARSAERIRCGSRGLLHNACPRPTVGSLRSAAGRCPLGLRLSRALGSSAAGHGFPAPPPLRFIHPRTEVRERSPRALTLRRERPGTRPRLRAGSNGRFGVSASGRPGIYPFRGRRPF